MWGVQSLTARTATLVIFYAIFLLKWELPELEAGKFKTTEMNRTLDIYICIRLLSKTISKVTLLKHYRFIAQLDTCNHTTPTIWNVAQFITRSTFRVTSFQNVLRRRKCDNYEVRVICRLNRESNLHLKKDFVIFVIFPNEMLKNIMFTHTYMCAFIDNFC